MEWDCGAEWLRTVVTEGISRPRDARSVARRWVVAWVVKEVIAAMRWQMSVYHDCQGNIGERGSRSEDEVENERRKAGCTCS